MNRVSKTTIFRNRVILYEHLYEYLPLVKDYFLWLVFIVFMLPKIIRNTYKNTLFVFNSSYFVSNN